MTGQNGKQEATKQVDDQKRTQNMFIVKDTFCSSAPKPKT
jgi:hypothetical protein